MLTDEFISYKDMHYIPDPMPQSMTPALILEAIVAHDYRPDEQSLLTAIMGTESGIPDIS